MPSRLLFLPGASGDTQFWRPVADLLHCRAERVHIGWPGFGATPSDPSIHGIEGLVSRVVAEIGRPTALIAQSMGGVIAILAALERPAQVTHLVLTATSGGVGMSDLGVHDWRPSLNESNPSLPRWFADYKADLTTQLRGITAQTLLLWGDADPISPIAVGQRLASLLRNSELLVVPGGNHDLGRVFAPVIGPHIDAHLSRAAHP